MIKTEFEHILNSRDFLFNEWFSLNYCDLVKNFCLNYCPEIGFNEFNDDKINFYWQEFVFFCQDAYNEERRGLI